jgi:hypothetical protein
MAAGSATRERLLAWLAGPPESWSRAALLGFGATALTLTGSFLNFLNYNHYPIGSTDTVLAVAVLLAAGLVTGMCAAGLGVVGRTLLAVVLASLAIDIHFDGLMPLLLATIAAVVFARFARQSLMLLFGVVLVSQLWTGMTGSRPASAARPVVTGSEIPADMDLAVVHLILDEHIGLEGIPESVPGAAALRDRLRTFYSGHGFRVFAGAYSESLHTVNAIPRALSLETASAWKKGGRSGVDLEQNSYFDALQSMGFKIGVWQSDWIDYCGHPAVESCATRPAGGLIDVGDILPASDKAGILIYRFTALSKLARIAIGLYDTAAVYAQRIGLDLPRQRMTSTNTSALNAMATFDEAIEAARSLTPGKAIFAHILLPHFPYVYDRTCGVIRLSQWLARSSAVTWEQRYGAYLDQVACATRKVDELLAAVATSKAAGKTVFIIHGDHGSRIVKVEPTIENDGRFSDRDLVDGHATLFAVSAPEIEPGYDTGRYPLRLLLGALASSEFKRASPDLPAGFVPSIAIEDRAWNPVTERPVLDLEWWRGQPKTAGQKLVP